ncbi:MAG: TonB-dependent receptor [Ignavibacteriae bacterium]|nr:TonB-dependent receptor [Ignavibacteriota bacterium]
MIKKIQKIILLVCLSYSMIFAGTTGKIAGTITDKTTGEDLIGVNIILVETGIGAASDENGYYFINNVPPGTYTLKVSYIGYSTTEVKNISISVDHTTEINIELVDATIELKDVVIVVAERELIRKDETSKRAVIDGSQITDKLPVSSIDDVIALQAGIVKDASGDLHIRGGRSGEITYLIDGVYVRNPFDNSLGGSVAVDAIQEMEVVSGTFNAEYGNALSGIVNVVTKEGTPKYKFRVQYESPMLNESPYHKADWLLDTKGVKDLTEVEKENYLDAVQDSMSVSAYRKFDVTDHRLTKDKALISMIGRFNGSFSGPIPFLKDKASFFIAGTFRNENSPLPFGFDLERVLSGKLTYRFLPTLKLQFNADWRNEFGQDYYHRYKYWQYFEESDPQEGSYPISEVKQTRYTLRLTHTVSNSTFYNVSLSRNYNYRDNTVPERTVITDPNTGVLISSDYLARDLYQGLSSNFMLGDVRYWRKTETESYDIDVDLTSQVNKANQVKAGFEFRQHKVFRHQLGMPPRAQLEYFTRKPIEFAAYVQDKIELSFLIVNLGLRLDYFDGKDTYFTNIGSMQTTITDDAGETILITVPEEPVPKIFKLSPRIGLAHPISETTVFHFAYGQFFQVPRYYDLYRNNDINAISQNDPLIGNPGLEPEETTAFEVGLKQQIGDEYALDVTAYYKDIDNLVSSFYYFGTRDYTVFKNADFGRVQGLDVTLTKKYSNYFSGFLNYSFMVAEGNESDPIEGFSQYREDDAHLRPNRTFPLDFDQRHSVNINLDVNFPTDFGPSLLGWKILENFSANLLMRVGSGLPYTPTSRDPDASIVMLPNSARKPWTSQFDMRVAKRFYYGDLGMDVYLRIENLFDQINVTRVWSRTGEAWSDGPTSNYSKDRQANPENVGTRRQIRAGFIIRL